VVGLTANYKTLEAKICFSAVFEKHVKFKCQQLWRHCYYYCCCAPELCRHSVLKLQPLQDKFGEEGTQPHAHTGQTLDVTGRAGTPVTEDVLADPRRRPRPLTRRRPACASVRTWPPRPADPDRNGTNGGRCPQLRMLALSSTPHHTCTTA
jgi:hypothetical protein